MPASGEIGTQQAGFATRRPTRAIPRSVRNDLPAYAAAVATQRIRFVVPVAEPPAFASVSIEMMQVVRLAVGVAVDHAWIAVVAKQGAYRFGVHIHDGRLLVALLLLALQAQSSDLRLALRQGQIKELLLPAAAAHLAAECLIGLVVGAQRIAMAEQRGSAIQVYQCGVGQQCDMAGVCQFFRHQEIAVSLHQEDACAMFTQLAQGGGGGAVERVVQIVIARPVFEQVAQDIQRFGLRGDMFGETQEQFAAARMCCAQVQIGDAQGIRHDGNPSQPPLVRGGAGADYFTTSALGVMTFSFWASWNPARWAGLTLRIVSTTSLPSTTLPNTQ